MAPPRKTTPELDAAFLGLVAQGETSAARLHRRLMALGVISVNEDGDPFVSEKTIGNWLKRLGPQAATRDTSPVWSFAESDSEHAQLVGDVFAYIADQSDFRAWLTRDVAKQVVRVRQVAPDAPAPWAYAIAYSLWRRVVWTEEQAARTDPEMPATSIDYRYVDLVLSARPWLGPERADWCLSLIGKFEAIEGDSDSWRDLWSRLHLLSDTSDGMLGCFGNPWPRVSSSSESRTAQGDNQVRQ